MSFSSRFLPVLGAALLSSIAYADGWLGVTVAQEEGGQISIDEVSAGGPAAQGGLKAGDVLKKCNGKELKSIDELVGMLGASEAGDHMTLVVRRGEQDLTLRVRLGERPDSGEEEIAEEEIMEEEIAEPQEELRIERVGQPGGAFMGVRLEETEDGHASIQSVVPDSPAARIGISAGEVIVEIDGKAIANPGEVVETIRSKKPGDRVKVRTSRGGDAGSTQVTYVFELGKAQPMEIAEIVPQIDVEPIEGGEIIEIEPGMRGMGAMRGRVLRPGAGAGVGAGAGAGVAEIRELREEIKELRAELAEIKALLQKLSRRDR